FIARPHVGSRNFALILLLKAFHKRWVGVSLPDQKIERGSFLSARGKKNDDEQERHVKPALHLAFPPAATALFQAGDSYTTLPPTMVNNTSVLKISAGLISNKFCETIMRSASLPGSSDPSRFSLRPANAAPSVYPLIASGRLTRSLGTKPSAGCPSLVWRVTAFCIPNQGFSVTTGQSLPKASTPPFCSMLCQGKAREARSGPAFLAHIFSVSSSG